MLTNARLALPGKNEAEYESMLKGSMDHIWNFLLRNLCRKCGGCDSRDVVNEQVIDAIVEGDGKGAVVVTSHQGDWENLIQYFRCREDLLPCNLYRKPKCQILDRLLQEMRGINQFCSCLGILKQFRNASEKKVFALIGVDQSPDNKGVQVDFLNRPTAISPVCVQIALKAGVPIVIAKTLVKNERTEVSFRTVDLEVAEGQSFADAVEQGLQRVMGEISSDISENPEQWVMWSHNFWKNAA